MGRFAKNLSKFMCYLTWIFLSAYAFAEKSLPLTPPEKWTHAKELFGMPHVWFAPSIPEQKYRSILMLTPTQVDAVLPSASEMSAEQAEYANGRNEWLKKLDGKALEFFKYENLNWNHSEVHAIGYRYELNGVEFTERSYFVTCKGEIFHLKSIIPKASQKADEPALQAALATFRCPK